MICAGMSCCYSVIPLHAYFKQKLELLYWDQKRRTRTRTYGYHRRASHSITVVSHQHAISFHRVSISQSFNWDYRTHCFWLKPYFVHSGLILYWCQSTFPQSLSSLLPLDLSLLAESALSFRFASRLCLTFGMGDLFAAFLGTITPDPSQAPFFFIILKVNRATEQNITQSCYKNCSVSFKLYTENIGCNPVICVPPL